MKRLLTALLVFTAQPVAAAELDVLTTGAFKSSLQAALPDFERQGHRVTLDNDTAGALVRRIENGARFDLVVLTPAAIDALAARALVMPGSRRDLAKVGIGVAVKTGAARPDISSAAAFRSLLLAAPRIAYIDPAAGGSSGIYLQKLFEQWGIAAQIAPKAVLVPGGLVAERVARGEAEIAIHQISEILPVAGVELVGPLPAEIQNYTTYAAALGPAPSDPAAARALLEHLAGPQTARMLSQKGMQAP